MAVKFSVELRNAMGDAIETVLGASPVLEIREGAPPANITDPRTGTVLATLNLPADAFLDASNGVKAKSGTWQDASADAAGTAGYYTLYKTDGTTVVAQGTVTATSGGGDLEVDNTIFAAGQDFVVNSFSYTVGNA